MKKSSQPPFDFRDLMNIAEIPPIAELPGQKVTVGAAVSEHGLVLVVLPEGGVDSLDLASYPNLVIGPIENDWDQIALLVDNVRSILEPPEVSRLYLRLDRNRLGENVVRMHSRLEASFGARLRIVEDREVASWRMKFPSRVALPDVPEDDAWATELLLGAAETALFGELAAGSLPSGLGCRDSEDDVRLAGALSEAFPHEPIKKEKLAEIAPQILVKRYDREATAISFSMPHLHLVTVYENENSRLALDTSRSRYLRYEGRDSKSVHTVQRKIGELLDRWNIERIALRVGLDSGQYRLSTLAYKLEAALQLQPGLDLRSLTTTEVMGFGRSWDEYLPETSGRLARKGDRQNQLNAIRTAALELFQREGRI